MNSLTNLKNCSSKSIEELIDAERMRRSLKLFIKKGWRQIENRDFIDNWHIDAISDHLQAVSEGKIKRLIINIPPRHMKSIATAVAFPAWTWTKDPSKQFMYASYAQSISTRDSVKCRRLIESPWYQKHFPNVIMTDDQNQKQRFENTSAGYRIATSVDGALTGEGGDIIVIDDPHNVREAESQVTRDGVLNWWDQAMQTRLNDPKTGAFVIIMQRVHQDDLTGHILYDNWKNEWDHLCLPARYEKDHPTKIYSSIGFKDPRKKEKELLWPSRFGEAELEKIEKALGAYGSAGQLQQRPMPKGGGILKADWWQPWTIPDLPELEYYVQSWDTAFSTKDTSSYSAMTAWGIFKHNGSLNIILMDSWYDRIDYPALRQKVLDKYRTGVPDQVIIEQKASGQSLIQDLRMANVPIRPYMPDRDKVTRAHTASALLENGKIWYIAKHRWPHDVIDICAAFPTGKNSDIVDTCTQAWILLRSQFIDHSEDKSPDDDWYDETPKKVRTLLY